MLTYSLPLPGKNLSQSLYQCIREDILSGRLAAGEKLPSKRALAEHLQISKTTVENAYYQLTAEGYLCSSAKRGYFVERVERRLPRSAPPLRPEPSGGSAPPLVDLSRGSAVPGLFPFSVWAKLGRRVLSERRQELLEPVPFQGTLALRQTIAQYLGEERGLSISPDNLVIGAGSEYLYGLLVRFFGPELRYGVEDPGFPKIRKIYRANNAQCIPIPLDGKGVQMSALEHEDIQVLHITPSHSYPSGQVTPLQRRQELLAWAEDRPGRYIIEDDYDCEFRFEGRPIPPLLSIDGGHRVIYLNTFSRSLAPSMRISYMVFPPELMAAFREKLGFFSCPVGGLEQYILASLIQEGYFQRHIARTRKICRRQRDDFLSLLAQFPVGKALLAEEKDAGLHFLLRMKLDRPQKAVLDALADHGLTGVFLSQFYMGPVPPGEDKRLLVSCAVLTPEVAKQAAEALNSLI